MSYAVIQTGGKQYKVKSGEILKIEKVKEKLKNNLPSVPTTLAEELECNIFLRAKDIKSFSKLRDLKDNF